MVNVQAYITASSAATGRTGLIKISVGESWLMVNQTRWKAICEPQPKSHGGGDGFASG
jgi:hypothetical protein